jgi:hypothetical protein
VFGVALIGATTVAFADDVDWQMHGYATMEGRDPMQARRAG